MLPILYSFRRCPYAIRARMALHAAQIAVELREVVLKNKPPSMLEFSPKGTVPVLVDGDQVIDESRDVMQWALRQKDPLNWLRVSEQQQQTMITSLVDECDKQFKPLLDQYKYSDRHPLTEEEYLQMSMAFLQDWDQRLSAHRFLLDDSPSLADVSIFPFVRQFAFVNKPRFDALPYPNLQQWLQYWLDSKLFLAIMQKIPPWEEGQYVEYRPFEET